MRSSLPKVLHPVCGRPMVAWPVHAAREAGAERVCVIVSPERDISAGLPEGTETVVQPEPDGTGGAIRAALDVVRDSEAVLVLSGDHPVMTREIVEELLEGHRSSGAAATVMSVELDDPDSYGRIVRDSQGDVARIVETKHPESVPPEELAIREINTGTYAFAARPLAEALGEIASDGATGEYYLGEVLPVLRSRGLRVAALKISNPNVNLGVNTRADLAAAEREARSLILRDHMLAGVTIADPDSTWIDADVEIAPDVRIEPATTLRGRTRIASGATIGPHSTLIDATVGEGASVVHSYLTECEVGARCAVGPFAHLRPGTVLRDDAKAGSFVEIKNSEIGEDAKVPHLSYVGDADVGAGTNFGAGAITANYDGFRKHRTKIGRDARIGVDTALVAPVDVGDAAYTGAGSVITGDVPEGALGISRADQKNVEGYADRVEEDSK